MLIIHIGLPKTATTALQKHVFPAIHGNSLQYLGVSQPRELVQDGLYKAIATYTSGEPDKIVSRDFVRNKLYDRLNDSDQPVLLSEEMLSVDQGKLTWQNKHLRLAELVRGIDHKILTTVRTPVDAIYSFFVESCESGRIQHRSIIDYFENHNNCLIYQYGQLFDHLSSCFNEAELAFLPFELLKNTEHYLNHLSRTLNVQVNGDILIKNENSKYISNEGTHIGRSVTPVFTPRNKYEKFDISRRMKLLRRKFFGSSTIFDRVEVSSLDTVVQFPSRAERLHIGRSLQMENKLFFEQTGIDYRVSCSE